MSCPDIDLLIEYQAGRLGDMELEAHVEGCPSCRDDLLIIAEFRPAFRPKIEVREELARRVLSNLPEPDSPFGERWRSSLHLLIAGTLGSLTGLGSSVVTGSIGSGSPVNLLLLSVGAGAVSVALHLRADERLSSETP